MIRILTAAVLIGVLLGALALPPVAFHVLALGVALGAWIEYTRLAKGTGAPTASTPAAILGLGVTGSFLAPRPDAPVLVLLAAGLLLGLAVLWRHWDDARGAFYGLASGLSGLVWIGLLLGCQLGIRELPRGATWLILAYATVGIGDSAAYYGGSSLGRRKLAPGLSPNKTIEGTLFGLAGSAATAAVVAAWLPSLSTPEAVVLGLALGAVGQAGDLLESALKRAADVKDSGKLLPGHGGILDRIDAHLPAGALLYVVVVGGWVG